MKSKIIIQFLLWTFLLVTCEQNESNNFILEGKIEGPNTKYIVLHYFDSLGVYLADTIKIENKKYFIEGTINNTQQVQLTSNLTGRFMEDPNRLMFFLEPKKININLKEGQFPKAKIKGSKTQIENENLDKTTKHFYEKIELIRTERQKLINKRKGNSNEKLETEIENLTSEWQKILDEIKNVQLQYAINNPQSYLSADIIYIFSRVLPKDSLEMFYSNLVSKLKASSYGLKIKEQINLHIVDSGDLAPDFSEQDLDGNVLSLNQFKGKTVLLDFGAAWCVPCVKNHPELKRIYNEYHSKGLEIIGISFDKDTPSWKENIKKEKLNWHHIYEGLNNVGKENSINKMYNVQPIPAYILINEKGIIIDRYSGADMNNKSLKDLEEKLNTLLSSN